MIKKLNTIELFAGCGGFVDGFEKAKKYSTLACVEWQERPLNVLKNRLRTKYNKTNIEENYVKFDIQRTDELLNGWNNDLEYGTNIGLKNIIGESNVDLIVGGPPCQAYSMAGRIQDEKGMKDDYRNYLFESYIKIVKYFKPKVIVFENVEGMLSATPDGVPIINRIRTAFNDAGYDIVNDLRNMALLDLSNFGVPQKRKRVILIGLRYDLFNEDTQEVLEDFYKNILGSFKERIKTVSDAIGDLPLLIPRNKVLKIGRKQYSHEPEITAVKDHSPRYNNFRDIEIFRELALDIEEKTFKYTNTEALKRLYTERTGNTSNVHKYNVLRWDEPSNTITAHLKKDGLRYIHPDSKQARTITVREAARLQTFDDDFEFSGYTASDYEMIGNAVPPKFAKKLAEALYILFEKHGL